MNFYTINNNILIKNKLNNIHKFFFNKIIFFIFFFFKYPFFFFKLINYYLINLLKFIFFLKNFFYFFLFFFIKLNISFLYLNFLIYFKNDFYFFFFFFSYNFSLKIEKKKYYLINELNNNYEFFTFFSLSYYLLNCCSNLIFNIYFNNNYILELSFFFITKLITFLFLDHNIQIKQLIDLFSIDYPNKKNRFILYYQFNTLLYNFRIFIKYNTNELNWLPSISYLFYNVVWYEREVFDLFGIHFSNNNDLRRILTDYGFNGFPLRKDFPLIGYVEICFNEEQNKLVYNPVQLIQSYRLYDTFSPWTLFYKKINSFYLIN